MKTSYLLTGTYPPLSSTDKMNDLDLIAITNRRKAPIRSAYNVTVKFDGNPLGRQCELINKLCDIRRGLDTALFAVEMDIDHIPIVNAVSYTHLTLPTSDLV